MFLKLQFDRGLDAVAGVLVGLFKGKIHQVLVVCARHVPTDEDDDVGQDLHRERTLSRLAETSQFIGNPSLEAPFCWCPVRNCLLVLATL